MGLELELAAVRTAVGELQQGPPSCFLSINVSPETVLSPEFQDALGDAPPHRVVLELTEHARIDDYETLHSVLAPMRAAGVRLAIDDTGAGYASLSHILRLAPDMIKLDASLVRGINGDQARLALASAVSSFATRIGATTTAECVENEAEVAALQALGIGYAQGDILGRPGALREIGCRTG